MAPPNAIGHILGPRPRLLVAFAVMLAALVVAFAWVFVSSQSSSRHQAQTRFAGEASLSAELTSTLFDTSISTASQAAAKSFGGAAIDPKLLQATEAKSGLRALVILDSSGRTVAATHGAPAVARSAPFVQRALAGHSWFSDVRPPAAGAKTPSLAWAIPFTTAHGRRVEVEILDATPIYQFLSSYLAKTQGGGNGSSFVLDSRRHIVGVAGVTGLKVGGYPKAATLLAALAKHPQGSYGYSGARRYFASAPVGGSDWLVVLSIKTSALYPGLAANSWLLYLLIAAFGAVALASLWFFRRALITSVALQRTNLELEERVAERTAAAEERAQELARSNAELEQFSSVASHDLQEPLRKIRMFGDRLRARLGDGLSPEAGDDLERMENAAARMQRLINDLLDFSRVTHRGKAFERVDLAQVTTEVIGDLEARIVELDAKVEVGVLPTIEADPTQMRQLMQNLIGNALKFHRPDEAPVVRIDAQVVEERAPRFAAESAAAGRAIVTVADNGIGFDEKHAERIFTAFERLHGRSAYDGTGIGLSIARKIVWRHGGDIAASGAADQGATFVVTLPLQQSPKNGHNGGSRA